MIIIFFKEASICQIPTINIRLARDASLRKTFYLCTGFEMYREVFVCRNFTAPYKISRLDEVEVDE